MEKSWKKRKGVVYSTDPHFTYEYEGEDDQLTLSPSEQRLKLVLSAKHRKGKQVTIISGFVGKARDLKDLAKILKTECGVGGSVKKGEIIIQGDMRDKIKLLLVKSGYLAVS
ncbi:translation initiation factor [Candidatus Omnitrophota bacterium]